MTSLIPVLLLSFALRATPTPDEGIKASFTKSFPAAEKVSWHEAETYHLVSFFNNGVQCRMYFDKSGNALQLEKRMRKA